MSFKTMYLHRRSLPRKMTTVTPVALQLKYHKGKAVTFVRVTLDKVNSYEHSTHIK